MSNWVRRVAEFNRSAYQGSIPEHMICYATPGCKAKFTGDYQRGNLMRHVKSCHPEFWARLGPREGTPGATIDRQPGESKTYTDVQSILHKRSSRNTATSTAISPRNENANNKVKHPGPYLKMHYTISQDTTTNQKDQTQARLAQLCRQKYLLRRQ
jgi:hypothetical protein